MNININLFILIFCFLGSTLLAKEGFISFKRIPIKLINNINLKSNKMNKDLNFSKNTHYFCDEFNLLSFDALCFLPKPSGDFMVIRIYRKDYLSPFDILQSHKANTFTKNSHLNSEYQLADKGLAIHFRESDVGQKINSQIPKGNIHLEMVVTNFYKDEVGIFLSGITETKDEISLISKSIIDGNDVILGRINKKNGQIQFLKDSFIKYFGKESMLDQVMPAFDSMVKPFLLKK